MTAQSRTGKLGSHPAEARARSVIPSMAALAPCSWTRARPAAKNTSRYPRSLRQKRHSHIGGVHPAERLAGRSNDSRASGRAVEGGRQNDAHSKNADPAQVHAASARSTSDSRLITERSDSGVKALIRKWLAIDVIASRCAPAALNRSARR